jgi:hypothetical protein
MACNRVFILCARPCTNAFATNAGCAGSWSVFQRPSDYHVSLGRTVPRSSASCLMVDEGGTMQFLADALGLASIGLVSSARRTVTHCR